MYLVLSLLLGLLYIQNAEGVGPHFSASWYEVASKLPERQECVLSSTDRLLKPFRNKRGSAFSNDMPCSYKMTNMYCGKRVQVEVWADNSYDENEDPYISRVTVNITTGRDNKTKTTQMNSITAEDIVKFLETGDTEGTPWKRSCPDCSSTSDTHVGGSFNRTSQTASLLLGKLNITFQPLTKTLTIFCGYKYFEILEPGNENYCDSPASVSNFGAAQKTFVEDFPFTDYHHHGFAKRYVALAKQTIRQSKPLCQEASQLMTSQAECRDTGEVIFECGGLLGQAEYYWFPVSSLPFQVYAPCIQKNRMDRFKVYVTCLRLLCGASIGRTPAAEDCNLLQKVSDKCQNLTEVVHTDMSSLMSRAGCPMPVTQAPAEPSELGASCTESSECGKNARCKGTPTKCTCKFGYASNDGKHCGKLAGKICNRNGQCVRHAKCINGTCQCKDKYVANEINFCVRALGESCACDCDCLKRAECSQGRCRCRSGYIQPDNDNTQCKLAAGRVCQRKVDCGKNARCTGNPPRCTCLKGYLDEFGRCGKPVGSNCTSWKECVRNAHCSTFYDYVCRCDYGSEKIGDFCYKEDQYCFYNSFHGTLEKFQRTVTNAKRRYYAFPCRYKMADIHCSGARAVVTIGHVIQEMNRRAQRRTSSGGIYIGDITVNVTTINDDGSLTSQISWLDATTFRKNLKKGNLSVSPWIYSYTGPGEPQGDHRVHGYRSGSYNNGRAVVTYKQLSVGYSTVRKSFWVRCKASDFKGLAETHETICGAPGDSDKPLLEDIVSGNKVDPHHDLAPYNLDVYIALAKQDVQQTDPQCQEAREVLTGHCENVGESLYECFDFYSTVGKCMRLKEMDSFQPLLSCLRLLCGQSGGTTEDTCGIFQKAVDACPEEMLRSHLNFAKLMKLANCTVATSPP